MIQPLNRRGKFWIDPDLQGRIVALVMMTVAAMLAIHFVVQKVLWWRLASVISDPELLVRLQSELQVFDVALLALSALAAIGLAFFSIRASHRLVGPLLKLKTHLGRVANGERPAPFSFRDADLLGGLPDLVNRACERRSTTRSSDEVIAKIG